MNRRWNTAHISLSVVLKIPFINIRNNYRLSCCSHLHHLQLPINISAAIKREKCQKMHKPRQAVSVNLCRFRFVFRETIFLYILCTFHNLRLARQMPRNLQLATCIRVQWIKYEPKAFKVAKVEESKLREFSISTAAKNDAERLQRERGMNPLTNYKTSYQN